jgi:HEAT repeat protein
MSNREIASQLALLALLLLAGSAFYAYQKSAAMVPVLIRHLDSDNFRVRQAASVRLQELGNAARAAAPRLLALTTDTRSRDAPAATIALSRIDLAAARAAMETAQAALRASDLQARRRAAEILGSLGLFARVSVPALIAASRDDDALVRDRALSALGRIGVPAAQIVPALIAALDDPAYHVRYAALGAIEEVPPAAAAEALPSLQRLAQDTNQLVRQRAQFALRRLGEKRPISIELDVARYSLVRERESQLYSLHRLARLGPPAAPLADELARLLVHPDDIVRYTAIETLGAIGPAARSAAAALRGLLEDRDPVIREAARRVLELIGEDKR